MRDLSHPRPLDVADPEIGVIEVLPLATDLYGGLPGVALFLAYLGAMTGESRYTDLAQAALDAPGDSRRSLTKL